jgi:hypothetical protein
VIRKCRRFVGNVLGVTSQSSSKELFFPSISDVVFIALCSRVITENRKKCILNWNNDDLITKEIPFDIFSAKCHTIREMQFETCRFCTTCKLRLIMQLEFLPNVYDFFFARARTLSRKKITWNKTFLQNDVFIKQFN